MPVSAASSSTVSPVSMDTPTPLVSRHIPLHRDSGTVTVDQRIDCRHPRRTLRQDPHHMRERFLPEHEDFRDVARTFFAKEVTPNNEQWDRDGIVPRDLWLKAGEAGLLCFDVPEQYGGAGID